MLTQCIDNFIAVKGALHIHTAYDDGEGTVDEVVEAGCRAGLDFIIITDHHEPFASDDKWHGWDTERKILILVGTEFKTSEKQHIVGLGEHIRAATREKTDLETLKLLSSLGLKTFIAHPQGRKDFIFKHFRYVFDKWDLDNYTGIEIWAYMHDWIEELSWLNLPDMCRNPDKYITGPNKDVLRNWDLQAQKRKVPGIGALDCHGSKLPLGIGRIFKWAQYGILPYEQNFKAFTQYLLVDKNWQADEVHDTRSVIAALSEGRGWVCHETLGSGADFKYTLAEGCDSFPAGTVGEFNAGNQILKVDAGREAVIKILCRGRVAVQTESRSLAFKPEVPGEYRVEVYLENRPWIFSNHIYLRKSEQ